MPDLKANNSIVAQNGSSISDVKFIQNKKTIKRIKKEFAAIGFILGVIASVTANFVF
ncbi:MAG: hypothetical protein ACD_19C00135G0001, partial [uncultured bacterium]